MTLDQLVADAVAEAHGLGHKGAMVALKAAVQADPSGAQAKAGSYSQAVLNKDHIARASLAALNEALNG